MTNEALERARQIKDKIDDLSYLHYIATRSYKKFFLTKKFLWMGNREQDNIVLCDDGLTRVIVDYCNNRISELREELESL